MTTMHCLRRATSRLSCSSISYTPATKSQLQTVIRSSSFISLRRPSHNANRFAPQARYYSESSTNVATSTPAPDYGENNANVEAAEQETAAAVKKTPGKRARRHGILDAFDAPRPPSDTVYMGNLFYDITAEDLRKHMEQYGTVMKTAIVHDNRGISKGFGYVQFDTLEAAQNAVKKQHMQIIAGRQVVVQYARSHLEWNRPEHPPSNTLFVGGIPFELTDRDVQKLFIDLRNTIDIRIPVDRRSGMPRGFAHVEFLSVEHAYRGMEVLMRKEPYGRKLRVHFADRKSVGIMKKENEYKRARFEKLRSEREGELREEEELREENEIREEEGAKGWNDDFLSDESDLIEKRV